MGGETNTPTYTIGEQVGAIAIVVIVAAAGGAFLGLLGGYKFP